jgi:hypothetical protein
VKLLAGSSVGIVVAAWEAGWVICSSLQKRGPGYRQIGSFLVERLVYGPAIACLRNTYVVGTQEVRDQRADFAVILDQEYMGRGIHAPPIAQVSLNLPDFLFPIVSNRWQMPPVHASFNTGKQLLKELAQSSHIEPVLPALSVGAHSYCDGWLASLR